MSSKISGPDLVTRFFVKDGDKPDTYVCTSCGHKFAQKSGSGYTNLRNHITSAHSREYENAATNKVVQKELSFRASENGRNIYFWLEWVIIDNLEFSFVESERAQRYCAGNLKPITRPTLMKYFTLLNKKVQHIYYI